VTNAEFLYKLEMKEGRMQHCHWDIKQIAAAINNREVNQKRYDEFMAHAKDCGRCKKKIEHLNLEAQREAVTHSPVKPTFEKKDGR
jgi:hypothetical protein